MLFHSLVPQHSRGMVKNQSPESFACANFVSVVVTSSLRQVLPGAFKRGCNTLKMHSELIRFHLTHRR